MVLRRRRDADIIDTSKLACWAGAMFGVSLLGFAQRVSRQNGAPPSATNLPRSDAPQICCPTSRCTIRSSARSATAAIVIDGLHAAVLPGISAPSRT